MKNLIQDTLEKIKKQNIAPEARWRYLLKRYGLWMLFGALVILGAVAFSTAFDNARGLDWDLYRFTQQNRMAYFFSVMPYFWTILAVIFLAGAFWEMRKTETGYRYSRFKMIGIIFGGVLGLGIFLSWFGWGGRFHNFFADQSPYYQRHMVFTQENQWLQPEKGFLAGRILSVSGNEFWLQDFAGVERKIQTDANTFIAPVVEIVIGAEVKIIGETEGENSFRAREIRPWRGRGMMRGGFGRGMMERNGQ